MRLRGKYLDGIKETAHNLNSRIEAAATAWDDKHYVQPVCTRMIICECGRRSCPGKTVSVSTYTRKIRQV